MDCRHAFYRHGGPSRFSIQAAVAALTAYGLTLLTGVENVSWAVFAALFVVHVSVGGTLEAAVGRLVGGFIGLLLGLTCLFTIGSGEWRTPLSLIVAVGTMSFIAGCRPGLSYGLVTTAILILAPGFEIVEGALLKGAAIAIGTLAGSAAATLILPMPARRGAARHLAEALRGYGELLEAIQETFVRGGWTDLIPLHNKIADELAQARSMAGQSLTSWFSGNRDDKEGSPLSLVGKVERIWYTLAILDRLSGRGFPAQADLLLEPSEEATHAYRDYFRKLADSLDDSGKRPSMNALRQVRDRLLGELDHLRRENRTSDLPRKDMERIFVLGFAWQQLSNSVESLAGAMDSDGRSDGRA
ncbi:FUSC family protein [Inquilinus sp. CAU 1745]|uniref:FUSC family protein n=1 Tax=Inquilinus sp. CAU 1745 TaxID=3140369 RepID=UPI00325A4711